MRASVSSSVCDCKPGNLSGPCLTCFSRLTLGFQKPAELRYRNLMDSHGQSLVQGESSSEISSLIRLQRLAERIAEVHSSDEPKGDPQMEALNAEVNIQMFQHELQEWRISTSTAIKNLRKCICLMIYYYVHPSTHWRYAHIRDIVQLWQ
jgi:hypothetical protein